MRDASRNLLCALLALAWPAAASFAQAPAPSQQQQSPPAGQSQSQPQTQTQSSTPPEQKQDSVAEAARKAKAKKAAAAQGKVFTEDDLSGMKKGGVSVVGNDNVKRPRRAPASDGDGDYAPNSEEYWRSRSQPLLDEMADIDQQIAQLKEDIKKYGPGGIDVATGYKEGLAYVEDRNGQIQKLQEKKANLLKQLDDLAEEGRKAGAQPAWFR
jgi:chromosome segregation ATPase